MRLTYNILFLVVFLFSCRLGAQCDQPNSQFSFLTNETIFCEGGEVTIDNKCDEENDTLCIDYMILSWRPGERDTFTDFENKTYIYDIPDSVSCDIFVPAKYDIKLTVVFHNGLSNSITKEVTVKPKPVARFSVPDTVCINSPEVCPQVFSCWDSLWLWEVQRLSGGPPETFQIEAPCFFVDALGEYRVQLTTDNGCGTDMASRTLLVVDTVSAIGSASPLIGCDSLIATFTDNSARPGVVRVENRRWIITPSDPNRWEYINETTDSSVVAEVNFKVPGRYTVELEVFSICNTDRKVIAEVQVLGAPSAQISGVTGGCLPHSVTPIAVNIDSAYSDNLSLVWSFPGGSLVPGSGSGTGPQPGTIQYEDPDTYAVGLTIANECDTVSYTQSITVDEPAHTDIEMGDVPANGCGPFTVSFVNNSIGGDPYWTVEGDPDDGWFFSNSTSANSLNPEITFEKAGNYFVHFSLLNVGCGDDSTWVSQEIEVKTKPVLAISESVDGCTGQGTFSAPILETGGFPANDVQVHWDFGPTAVPPMFYGPGMVDVSFPPDTHTVEATASNACGDTIWLYTYTVSEEAVAEVFHTPPPPNNCGPYQIDFTNTSSGAEGPYTWTVDGNPNGWSFYDTTSANSENPIIRFDSAGDYTVQLTVPNSCDTAYWSETYTVYTAPVAALADIPGAQCVDAEIVPYTTEIDLGGDPSATVAWFFPEGMPPSSSILDPGTIDYPNMGNFDITLIVSNICASDTATASFFLDELSDIQFYNPDTVCIYDLPFPLQASPGMGNYTPFDGLENGNRFNPASALEGWNIIEYTWGSGNCVVSDFDSIYVVNIEVSAGLDEAFCDTLAPSFFLAGTSPIWGEWVAGNGLLSGQGEYSPVEAGYGVDTLTYRVTEPISGCSFSDTKYITIHEPPEAQANIPQAGCKGAPISFSVNPAGLETAIWLTDNHSLEGFNVQYSYPEAGGFPVTVIVEDTIRCRDTLTQTIHISEPPVARFSSEPDNGCAPVVVAFTNESQGEIINCEWDYGNGGGSGCIPSSITYPQGTTVVQYFPTLTVSNACGDSTFTDTITVRPMPQPNFEISRDTICSGQSISFNNISQGDPDSFVWIDAYGNQLDDISLLDTMYYTDTDFQTYTITLIATNGCGTVDTSRSFVVEPNNFDAFFNLDRYTFCQYEAVQIINGATPGTTVTYDFGDDTTSMQPNPVHMYQSSGDFVITQYATDGCGVEAFSQPITINPAPVIEVNAELPEVCQGQEIEFSAEIDIPLRACSWEFGDSTQAPTCNPTHVYQNSDNYQAVLTVTNINTGCIAKDSTEVLVRPNPVASATTTDTVGCENVIATFTNQNDTGYTHLWTFPNGTSTDTHPSWEFNRGGIFSVSLLTTDDYGCSDDTTFYNIIRVNPAPEAAFELQVSENCILPASARTINQSSGAMDYEWYFSTTPPNFSQFTDTTITINIPGSYDVRLIAENQYHCADTAFSSFIIHPEIMAAFDLLQDILCAGNPLVIENLSQNTNRYTWAFSNGETVNGAIPVYAFPQAGIYSITLVAALDTFCYDTVRLTDIIEVLPSPEAGFVVRDTFISVQPGGAITIRDTSVGAIKYLYDFGDGDTSTVSNPFHRYFANGEWLITQQVENQWGCLDTAIVHFEPSYFDGLFIPTALMPDVGEGEYQVFQPKGVGLATFKIEVFSPAGERVWYSELLQDGQPAEYWDGNDMDGNPLPQGAYVWKVEATFEDSNTWQGQSLVGEKRNIIGSVTIIR